MSMLKALYDLALRENLSPDPDYEPHRVDYFLRIDDEGRALSLIPTANEQGRALERSVPRLPKRAGVDPGYFFDSSQYLLGVVAKNKKPELAQRSVEAITRQVNEIAERVDDVGARAVASFFRRRETEFPKVRGWKIDEWTGSEWIAFVRDADGAQPVFDRPVIRAEWARRRNTQLDGSSLVRCLVTGRMAPAERLHGSIKLHVEGAQTSGTSLVSFNKEAFESQSLEQGSNAPVSREAATGYVSALNWLLASTPTRKFRYGVGIGAESVTVFWARENNAAADLFTSLLDPTADDAVRLAEAPLRGLAPADGDTTPFYAVTLGASAARVVVRDWYETTVADAKRNVLAWFSDLWLGTCEPRPLSISMLLKSVESPGGGLSPDLASRLFAAALRGRPIPREVLVAALGRLRLPPDKQYESQRLHDRCALVKAALIRSDARSPNAKEVTVALDETNHEVPYLLGRLFAVLERLQGAALGDVNATIRDKYFGAASSTPALVFPRLLQLSVHHAAKAEGSGWLEQIKGRVMATLPAERFPRMQSLGDQGLFAVGYYHQRESFFQRRSETHASDQQEANEVREAVPA